MLTKQDEENEGPSMYAYVIANSKGTRRRKLLRTAIECSSFVVKD